MIEETSFRLILENAIGCMTWISSITQRIAGFQWIASKIPRAADGVIIS